MSKQNNLTDFLTDVADAIRQKKGTQAPINPQDFSSEIASIPTGGNNPLQDMLDRTSDTNGSHLFFVIDNNSISNQLTYENLIALDFSNKHYTSTPFMFSGCSSLTTVPQLDFSKVTDTSYMFSSCGLTTIPQLDFSSVVNAAAMFSGCLSLTTIPQLNFSKVTSANSMFNGCESLTTVPQLDFSSVTSTSSMFSYCKHLTTLDFSNIKTIGAQFANTSRLLSTLIIRNSTTLATLENKNAFNKTPISSRTGYIYVPDDLVDSYKQATNWSTYAAQIKGLSELPQGE